MNELELQELQDKRNELWNKLFTLCNRKLNKEETRFYCEEIIQMEYPEELEYTYGYVADWGNDYHVDMRLCFCTDKIEKFVCCRGDIYVIKYYSFRETEKEYVMRIYPYTEEELIQIEQDIKNKELEKKAKQFKINKNPFTTKMKFGKYKGELVVAVMDLDPQYIEWAINKIDGFKDYIDKIKIKQN